MANKVLGPAIQVCLAALTTIVYLNQELWSKAEKLGLAVFCGNQHNPDWRWKDNLTFDEFLQCLLLITQFGEQYRPWGDK